MDKCVCVCVCMCEDVSVGDVCVDRPPLPPPALPLPPPLNFK